MTDLPDVLLPVLVHVQTNLDGDLDLSALSALAGLSPSHFHRVFKAHVGETPADYVVRLRLERAAFRLQIHDVGILQLALECGYRNHETFTRAFRRAFGVPPTAYRRRQQTAGPHAPARAPGVDSAAAQAISATRIVRLREAHLAFIRHVGPYEAAPDSLFDDLEQWAQRRRLPGPRVWMGIGHDAPGTTPSARLRFDAALVVPQPFAQDGLVGHQVFAGGEFAVTTHVGAYASLPAAYAAIFPRVVSMANHDVIGLPAVEMYRAARINARLHLNETDICLPVSRRTGRRDANA